MRIREKMIVSAILIILTASCVGGMNERISTETVRVTVPVLVPSSTNTPVPTVVEPGLAYGIPCQPPCWQYLTPGKSTVQEATQAMERLRVDGWADRVAGGPPDGGIFYISPLPYTSKGTIYVALEDDVVAWISGQMLFYHPIGTLISQFGTPEKLYVTEETQQWCSSCDESRSADAGTGPGAGVNLLYPGQGLWFLAVAPFGKVGCICPEMEVIAFCYYTPTSIQEVLDNNSLCPTLPRLSEEDLTEWHGFGGGY